MVLRSLSSSLISFPGPRAIDRDCRNVSNRSAAAMLWLSGDSIGWDVRCGTWWTWSKAFGIAELVSGPWERASLTRRARPANSSSTSSRLLPSSSVASFRSGQKRDSPLPGLVAGRAVVPRFARTQGKSCWPETLAATARLKSTISAERCTSRGRRTIGICGLKHREGPSTEAVSYA